MGRGKNGRADMEPARPFCYEWCSGRESWWSVSAGPDGERVKVVGENAPACPGALAFVAPQAAATHSVAALEVADAALGACAIAL